MLKKNKAILRLPKDLFEVLRLEFAGDERAVDLFRQFLECATYSRQFVWLLIDVARGTLRDSWEVRQLATLMLQEHLLALDASNTAEFSLILQQLGLPARLDGKFPKSVFQEGYSCRDLAGFVREFRRRLTRPRCAVRPRSRRMITGDNVREFVQQSRQDCKLALARYLFAPDEVVARIHAQVKLRSGMPLALDYGLAQDEARQVVHDLPDYEAAILRLLQSDTQVFWVADETPSKLNALVEYPLGTVVLVVKPPGSHFEFELKRAGRRGDHPLSVRSHVPPSHRLDGGSMVSALQWDAEQTARFGHLYRHVHGVRAPLSRIVNLLGKSDVPVGKGECPIIEFLTNRAIYGAGYDEMRKAMAIVVECFREERGNIAPRIPGDYGLTTQFFAFAGPAQATICGSSSFRLDLLAKYLSSDGPVEYFTRGLKVEYQALAAKRLADDVLDEVLGVYRPPDVEYRDHEQYVAAALAVPKNRAQADANYGNLLKQIGTMWGTLMAARGYSFGESFVARNVGLRTIWSRGRWWVRLVFQDHDNLVFPDGDQTGYWPQTAIPATELDDCFIVDKPGGASLNCELTCLQRIYRVAPARVEKGRKQLRGAMKRAYVRTQQVIRSNPQQSRIDKRFAERLRDWDTIARHYVARNGSSNGQDWKSRVQKFLEKRGYSGRSIEEHCRALEQHGSFVEKYSFLYGAKIGGSRQSRKPQDSHG